jgi:uncharacterized protein YjiS (DUF1127 family)
MTSIGLSLPALRFGTGLGHALQTLVARWQEARARAETRRYLSEMDDHMLQDLGVSRAQALFEVDHALRRGARH